MNASTMHNARSIRASLSGGARLLFLGTLSTQAFATTDYYVNTTGSDSSVGTQAAPFKTIIKAASVVTAGGTVHVGPGSYAGGFQTSASGTPMGHIIYISDIPGAAKVIGSAAINDNTAGWWNSGDYVDIKYFDIDGNSNALANIWSVGIYNSGSNDSIVGNRVHDILTTAPAYNNNISTQNGGAGIDCANWYGGVNCTIVGNVVYSIGLAGAKDSLVHGIYEVTNGSVYNNITYNVSGFGITTWHDAHNINIFNNTVDRSGEVGIFIGAGDGGIGGGALSASAGDYINVFNNIITNSGYYGIEEHGTTGPHNTYANNTEYNSQTSISLLTGSQTGNSTANPTYVNATANNYHILAGSPAIDSGVASNAGVSAPSSDYSGTVRPQGSGYDRGAYEYQTLSQIDIAPPSVPAGLSTTAVSPSQINLTWNASTDNVAVVYYNVFRNGVHVGASTSTSYSDTGLFAGTSYSYTLAAYDAAGNGSAQSSASPGLTLGWAVVSVGGRVVPTANLTVRQTAALRGTKLGTQAIGSQGTVVSGPTSANGHIWWRIDFDAGVDGWCIGDYLVTANNISSPAL